MKEQTCSWSTDQEALEDSKRFACRPPTDSSPRGWEDCGRNPRLNQVSSHSQDARKLSGPHASFSFPKNLLSTLADTQLNPMTPPKPTPLTLNPQTLNPPCQTVNPQPSTLNSQPSARTPAYAPRRAAISFNLSRERCRIPLASSKSTCRVLGAGQQQERAPQRGIRAMCALIEWYVI
jgi:hypothetical protein